MSRAAINVNKQYEFLSTEYSYKRMFSIATTCTVCALIDHRIPPRTSPKQSSLNRRNNNLECVPRTRSDFDFRYNESHQFCYHKTSQTNPVIVPRTSANLDLHSTTPRIPLKHAPPSSNSHNIDTRRPCRFRSTQYPTYRSQQSESRATNTRTERAATKEAGRAGACGSTARERRR